MHGQPHNAPYFWLVAAVSVHAVYRIYVAAVFLHAAMQLKKNTRASTAQFASDALAGLLRVAVAAFAKNIEKTCGASNLSGPKGDALFFFSIAAAAAACNILPAVAAGVSPSSLIRGKVLAGGIGAVFASEALAVAGRTVGGVLLSMAAGAVSTGGVWRRWTFALVLASVFAGMEILGAVFNHRIEQDLLYYEPGESVRPLRRPELVERVKQLCADLGMPDAAGDVMVDDADEDSLNAFAINRVIVLSKRTAAMEDVEHAAAIVAHELGHVKLKHVRKSMALNAALTAARFALFFVVIVLPGSTLVNGASILSAALPLTSLTRSAALLYGLVRPLVGEAAELWALWYSRSSELAADRLGYGAVGKTKYAEMLVELQEANPDMGEPYDSLLRHMMTHPPVSDRIQAVREG